jgi:hypothetical protein
MKKAELAEEITIGHHDFELVKDDEGNDIFYQCRGEVMYDDEHDQMPEPSLWRAAQRVVEILKADGHKASRSHSEKGWVEVNLINP